MTQTDEAMLTGLYVPLITPFTTDGEVAADALESLAHRVLDDGAAGLVALGTTAETADAHRRRASPGAGHLRPGLPGARGAADRRGRDQRHGAVGSGAGGPGPLPASPRRAHGGAVLQPSGRGRGARAFPGAGTQQPRSPARLQRARTAPGRPSSWQTMQQLAEVPGIAGVKHAAGVDRPGHDRDDGRPAARLQRPRRR